MFLLMSSREDEDLAIPIFGHLNGNVSRGSKAVQAESLTRFNSGKL